MNATSNRGMWGSRLGFVLAASGSAVGLGNIWKFPYITGEYGGGAFVLIYLFCILLVGLPIMYAELLMGKVTQKDPVGAFKYLQGTNSSWQIVGWMGVISAFVILSFYSVVAGWSMAFVARSAVGAINYDMGVEAVKGLFTALYEDPFEQIFWHLMFMIMVVGIVSGGVKKGIERWSEILMPGLILLLLVLMGFAMTLEGFREGVRFMFSADFSQVTPPAVLEALGHSFFTLSLGMGAMITYGSYLPEDANIPRGGMWIVILDTGIALLAGLIIFPIVFTFDLESGAGPGLIFSTLPVAFAQLPAGGILSAAFFVLLGFAALSSAISLLEVAVAFFHDELGWDRRLAAVGLGAVVFLLGIPSAAYGQFFDFMDNLSTNYLLPLGGLGVSVYAGWVMDREDMNGAFGGKLGDNVMRIWLLIIKFVTPFLVLLVFLNKIGVIKV